jgi:hypothetical protein
MRKDIKLFLKKNLYNLEDIRHHFYDVWRSWKEWFAKINKIANIVTINIIGKKDKNRINWKVIYYLFGDSIIKRKRSM